MTQKWQSMDRIAFDRRLKTLGLNLFYYDINRPGFKFIVISAILLWLISTGVYIWTHFSPVYWGVIAGLLTVFGLYWVGVVAYWIWYARKHYIAFNDQDLYLVGRQVWFIPWKLLTFKNTGLDDQSERDRPGILSLAIGDDERDLLLFNPYIWIEDLEGFMAELLHRVKENAKNQEDQTHE